MLKTLYNCHTHFAETQNISILNIGLQQVCNSVFSIGIHPWQAELIEDNFLVIEQNARKKNCLAIGEIGLDKLKGPELSLQIEVFSRQIRIAEETQLPVIIHCVKAWNEIQEIKKKINPRQTWIYHGFIKVGILQEVLKMGLMISIGGAILTNKKLQTALLTIPDDKLLLETDDADVTIFEIYQKVSEIKKISLPTLEKIIEENFIRTFTKWQIGLNGQN